MVVRPACRLDQAYRWGDPSGHRSDDRVELRRLDAFLAVHPDVVLGLMGLQVASRGGNVA